MDDVFFLHVREGLPSGYFSCNIFIAGSFSHNGSMDSAGALLSQNKKLFI